MAKKKSTATQKSITSSEPRITSLRQWAGVNINEKSPGWNPVDSMFGDGQADLMDNFLMVQNNCSLSLSKGIETRDDDETVATAPAGIEFTGVACLQRDNLICAFSDGSLRLHVLGDDPSSWAEIPVTDPDGGRAAKRWTEIDYYASKLICFSDESECFVGDLSTMTSPEGGVRSYRLVPEPTQAPTLSNRGSLADGTVSRIQVCYVYTNIFGSTTGSPIAVKTVSASPVEWSAAQYMEVSGTAPTGYGVTGVDVYFTMDDNTEFAFAGHVNLTDGGEWRYAWLGALADTSQWTNVSLEIPTENTTKGVNAKYMTHIDGRLYFWGGDLEYRLYIGGNPGNELSVARGVGGAFVDIEPGTGITISNVLKHKTYSASSIVTIMCGNPNTGQVKRFNLLETNVTVTNELSSKGYMTEEVSNVVGCNSRWGCGVFDDGLYAVSRYGLALTTHAMEYNNQLRVGYVSDQLKPIFTDRLGNRLNNARLVYIDGIVYLVLAEPEGGGLDNVIFCYDISAKAWWTYTYDTSARILHVMSIDSQDHWEGLGIITPGEIAMIPCTAPKEDSRPNFGGVLLMTGELSARQPPNESVWLEQLEFDFDYLIGDLEIDVSGTDYYGRDFHVKRSVGYRELQENHQEWVRVGMIVRTYRVKISGEARFRMFQILQKTYSQSAKIGLVYGLDTWAQVKGPNGTGLDRHRIEDYNNLRDVLVP